MLQQINMLGGGGQIKQSVTRIYSVSIILTGQHTRNSQLITPLGPWDKCELGKEHCPLVTTGFLRWETLKFSIQNVDSFGANGRIGTK